MYTAINGIFDNGQIIFEEAPPTTKKMKVIITFLEEVDAVLHDRQPGSLLRLGALRGKSYSIPDDFNDPLEAG